MVGKATEDIVQPRGQARHLAVVVHFRDAVGKKPQPPRTRSITKAFALRYFLRVPSWPWWLTISKIAPLPVFLSAAIPGARRTELRSRKDPYSVERSRMWEMLLTRYSAIFYE